MDTDYDSKRAEYIAACEDLSRLIDSPDKSVPVAEYRTQLRLAHIATGAAHDAMLEAMAMPQVIHVHHHDIEAHARSYNEGYEAAVTQGLADDPAAADDWLQVKLDEVKADVWDEGVIAEANKWMAKPENPYRSQS